MWHDGAMTDAPGIRARNRAAIEAEILAVAGRHLAEYGAAALSLRAIARELGMVSSAVYRYVESRDELLTRLIVAAYDDLADRCEEALAAADIEGLQRFRVIARTTHAWARDHPHDYALIYGSPVPGYHAPADRTNTAGTRVPGLLVEALVGRPEQPPAEPLEAEAFQAMLGDPMFASSGLTAGSLRRGLAAWTLVLGAITTELFEQFGPQAFGEGDAWFELMLEDAVRLAERA